jgi:hypothetical protein
LALLGNPYDHVRLKGSCPFVKPSNQPDLIVGYSILMEKLLMASKDLFVEISHSNHLAWYHDGHDLCRDTCLTYHGFGYSAYRRNNATKTFKLNKTTPDTQKCFCLKSLEAIDFVIHHSNATSESHESYFEIYKTGLFGKLKVMVYQ